MDDLVKAIVSALQEAEGLSYIPDADIFVTSGDGYAPPGVHFPCIGVKDGPIHREEGIGGTMRTTLEVSIVIHAPQTQGAVSVEGVMQIAKDIHDVLDENTLDLSGVIMAFCSRENASMRVGESPSTLQRKELFYTYEREGIRP